jgi:hypothetical protein
MKKTIILFILLFSFNSFSQFSSNKYKKGTLYLRDSSHIRGLVKISGNEINFKKTAKDKKEVFNYRKVKRLKFLYEAEYLFKIYGNKKVLLPRVTSGKLDLYLIKTISSGIVYREYYIGYTNSNFVEKLPKKTTKKKFRKILSEYTSDCQGFLERIKNKENIEYYFPYNDLIIEENINKKESREEDMINYYNSHCN